MLPPQTHRNSEFGRGADEVLARYWRVVVGKWKKNVHSDSFLFLDASVVGGWKPLIFLFSKQRQMSRRPGALPSSASKARKAADQRSLFLYQYWYWADRSLARSREDPTLQAWLTLILSFKNLQALSMTWAPAFTVIFFLAPGMEWVTRRTKV